MGSSVLWNFALKACCKASRQHPSDFSAVSSRKRNCCQVNTLRGASCTHMMWIFPTGWTNEAPGSSRTRSQCQATTTLSTAESTFRWVQDTKSGAYPEHCFPAPSTFCQNWLCCWRGTLYLFTQLSTDTVSALQKVWVLMRLWKQPSAKAPT